MNITLTIDVKPEVLKVLQEFMQHFTAKAPASEKKSEKKAMEIVKDKPALTGEDIISDDPVDKKNDSGITLEQVRAAAQIKQQAGKRDGIKALLVEFDAKNVSTLSKEHYPEFLKKVQAL